MQRQIVAEHRRLQRFLNRQQIILHKIRHLISSTLQQEVADQSCLHLGRIDIPDAAAFLFLRHIPPHCLPCKDMHLRPKETVSKEVIHLAVALCQKT